MSRFNQGDIVRISKDSEYFDEDYEEDGSGDIHNPCANTNGKIRSFHAEYDGSIVVDWDNGNGNSYYERDLRLVRRNG